MQFCCSLNAFQVISITTLIMTDYLKLKMYLSYMQEKFHSSIICMHLIPDGEHQVHGLIIGNR